MPRYAPVFIAVAALATAVSLRRDRAWTA